MKECYFCHRTEKEIENKLWKGRRNRLNEGMDIPCVYWTSQDIQQVDGPYIRSFKVDICNECLYRGTGFSAGLFCMSIQEEGYSFRLSPEMLEEVRRREEAFEEEYTERYNNRLEKLENKVLEDRKHPWKHLLKSIFSFTPDDF